MIRLCILYLLCISNLAILSGVEMSEDRFHLGVKAIIRNNEGKVLLLEKQRRNKPETFWDLPGGRMNRGESMVATLERELQEEVSLHQLPHVTFLGMHLTKVRISQADCDVGLILALYAVDSPVDFRPVLSDEHCNFGWFDRDAAVGVLQPQYPVELIEKIEQATCLLQH